MSSVITEQDGKPINAAMKGGVIIGSGTYVCTSTAAVMLSPQWVFPYKTQCIYAFNDGPHTGSVAVRHGPTTASMLDSDTSSLASIDSGSAKFATFDKMIGYVSLSGSAGSSETASIRYYVLGSML